MTGAPNATRTRDLPLRRSSHAGVNLHTALVEGCSLCPRVAAGDRSFPPVLVRNWHASQPRGLDSRSVRDRARSDALLPEKRKVGGSTPPLTTGSTVY